MGGRPHAVSQFLASCPECKDKVTTNTKLDGGNLDHALAKDEDIEVACFPREHNWKLTAQDKANLREQRATE